jgi:hypothetical protein
MDRIVTVLRWPTMLYVNAEVALIIRKVESETRRPQHPAIHDRDA